MSEIMAGQSEAYQQGFDKGYKEGIVYVIDKLLTIYKQMAEELSIND